MYFLIIFLFTFIFRSIFIFFFPETGGDYDIYSKVAKNILRGCGVSLSDPLLDDCVPHFGGNHGPGYDAFISLIWYLTDYSNNAVRLIQAAIYSFFCIYLLYAVSKLVEKKIVIFSLGLIFAISPLLVAWPRYIQTETLAVAFTLFLISEILISLKQNRVRIIGISIALTLSTWIRLDSIFLTIPVAFCCFYIHGARNGFFKGLVIASLLSTSWGFWTVRNIAVDLPSILPTNMIMPDGSRSPTGYLKWTKTWITHEYEKPGSLWGVNRQNYNKIFIPEHAYFDDIEKAEVKNLIFELKKFDGKPFPKEIDEKFYLLAEYKKSKYPFKFWFLNPLERIYKMWTNPFSSFGWPNEIPSEGLSHNERLNVAKGNINVLLLKIKKYPFRSISKGINAIYKFSILILYIYFLYFTFFKNKNDLIKFLGYVSLSYFVARTLFFSFNGMFETRYIVTIVPFMELFICLCFFEKFFKKMMNTF